VELFLVRHAEPVRVELTEGVADPPLHARGVEQARRLADWLADEALDRLVTSPLLRSRETADAIAATTGLTPDVDEGVAEYDRQSTEYIPVEELRRLKDERWEALVDGRYMASLEDAVAFGQRVAASIEAIVAANPGRRVAVVCHGGVINHYLCDVLGTERRLFFEPRYASISRVAASRQGIRTVVSLNETAHLRGLPGFTTP
jgi:broad specificity phosphatase PhoE